MFSLENLFQVFGDNSLADRLELLAFNALPGAITPDMWAHQYDQQSNQVLVSVAKRDWSTNRDDANIYGLMPDFACCLANMHQGWPKYIEHMWMATNDNGLILASYGPSVVRARTGKGQEVKITEETEYPFRGQVVLTINTEKPAKFPLYLRIPGWGSATVSTGEESVSAEGGTTFKLERKWENGDQVIIDIPMEIRFEDRYNNSLAVLRGPLYFSLRIEKEYNSTKLNYDNFSYMGSVDWEIKPLSAWNYGLILDRGSTGNGYLIEEQPVGKFPFADRGDMIWTADSGKYYQWEQDPPVTIRTRGFRIPGWEIKDNSADIPPPGPIKVSGEPEEITLIPYGSAKLRITEFPVMDITLMESENLR